MDFKPYGYQNIGIQWIKQKKRCCLFWEMGLGKSVVTLTAVQDLIDTLEVGKALVVAPKKVAEATWSTEAEKWSHLSTLRVSKIMGTVKQRLEALNADADVYVIGRDSFVWLCQQCQKAWPFDMVVIDELTSFKSQKASRFKAMKWATARTGRMVGLTGTPAPNGLADLWAQLYCIDMGERLGKYVGRYRDEYFNSLKWGNVIIRLIPKPGAEAKIRGKIADICLTMQAKDYLTLPKLMRHVEKVTLAPDELARYREFEREKVMEFGEADAVAASAAAMLGKLTQYANGAVYDTEGAWHEVSKAKLERLCEIVEEAGSPVLVFYQYKSDLARITDALKDYKPRQYSGEAELRDWNAGKVRVLLAHPASTAYGLNMQQGGNYIVWFGLGWNLELYQQANARLHRQGQTKPVHVYELIAEGTADEKSLQAITGKKGQQQALMDAMKEIAKKYL